MDNSTGKLYEMTDAQARMLKDVFTPVRRDLTERERFDKQIQLYSPCGCGSGKKFKFCHYQPHAVKIGETA